MIDLNSATLSDLLKVPGISRGQAQALYSRRPFFSWREVLETPGMTPDVIKWLQAVGLRLGDTVALDPERAGAARAARFSRPGEPTDS